MSDPNPEERARPQYGEYATPEEQRARIRQPAHVEPIVPAPAADPGIPMGPPSALTAPADDPKADTARRWHPVDRVVTFALLAYGLVNVVTAIPQLVDYAAYTETVFTLLGVDAKLTDPAAGKPWGLAAAIVMALGWLATALVTWWNLRRGRVSWWIPVVGGIVFTLITGTLMLIPLMSDPAVWSSLVGSMP
jgi:hypothetical protein